MEAITADLYSKDENKVERKTYPRTKEKNVFDENNVCLAQKIADIIKGLSSVSTNIGTTINTAITERTAADVATKAELGQLSNPNILINPDFKINQRGLSEYNLPAMNWEKVYTVDRWFAYNRMSKITKLSNGIRFERLTNGESGSMYQSIENASDYRQKILTLSIKVTSIITAPYVILRSITDGTLNNELVIKENGIHSMNIRLGDISSLLVGVQLNDAGTVDIEWMKLELGSAATPFTPPDPATELVKCQRYFRPVISWDIIGQCISATYINAFYSFEPMRVTPTFVIGDSVIINVSGVGSITDFTTSQKMRNGTIALTIQTTGLEKHQLYGIVNNSGSSDIVGYLDAEIH